MAYHSVDDIMRVLRSLSNKKNVESMRKFGIASRAEILGVPKPKLRKLAREIGVNHDLALMLWRTNVHEARILATMIADPRKLDDKVLEELLIGVDNWDLADQLVLNLLWRMNNAFEKAVEWCRRPEEYIKRIGYALLAKLVWRNKIGKEEIEAITSLIIEGARDERPYVYKAVAWLLKWLAKRRDLKDTAAKILEKISALGTTGSKFIVREARQYLT